MPTAAVKTSLAALRRGLSDTLLTEAFGPDSLGIILISDLPAEYHALRVRVLRSASLLAKLDDAILQLMECPEAFWLVGWSLGKEKLTVKKETADGGVDIVKKPDYLKGSYYINCSFFIDDALEGPPVAERERFDTHLAYTTLNRWPDLHRVRAQVVQSFESDCKRLCKLIISISLIVARNCDRFIEKEIRTSSANSSVFQFPENYLESVVKNSYTTKARLLHYYPKSAREAQEEGENTWCGEHLDHSCLTGLTSAMYLDERELERRLQQTALEDLTESDIESLLAELDSSPDPEAGLYIKNRRGEVVKVAIPKDCLAFQTGSALQEISQNRFKAVPHYVKGCNVEGVARNTLAVFCQPNLGDRVNEKETFSEYADRILSENH